MIILILYGSSQNKNICLSGKSFSNIKHMTINGDGIIADGVKIN